MPSITSLSRDEALWKGRLQNILTAIQETRDQADLQIQVRDCVDDTNKMFSFQLRQLKSLRKMLDHMVAFGQVIQDKCIPELVSPKNGAPRLDLIRTTFHELSTDLNLVQRALNQRLWAVKLSAEGGEGNTSAFEKIVREVSSNSLNTLVSDPVNPSSGLLKEIQDVEGEITALENLLKKKDQLGTAIDGAKKVASWFQKPDTQTPSNSTKSGESKEEKESKKNLLAELTDLTTQLSELKELIEKQQTTLETALTEQSKKLTGQILENETIQSIGQFADTMLEPSVRSQQTKTLIFADVFATYALAPAKGLIQGIDENSPVKVITYFTENNVSVRILPYYTDTILVGMPYSTSLLSSPADRYGSDQIPWEFLSLPHEIGHYLFWNGAKDGTDIDNYLRKQCTDATIEKSDWRYHWLEELFADTFKCLLMGPAAVLGLQVMLSDAATKEQLLQNNGYHPIPAVRPLLASRIVEALAKEKGHGKVDPQTADFLDTLDKNWKAFLDEFGISIDGDTPFRFTIFGDVGSGSSDHSVKGQWTNHQHRDQPGEHVIWPTGPISKTYAELESEFLASITTDFRLIQASIDLLTGAQKEIDSQASIFEWPVDTAEVEGKTAEEKLLYVVSNRFKELQAFAGESAADPVRDDGATLIRGYENEFSTLVKTGPATDIIEALELNYIANWGDKGPRGGNTGT